MPQFSSNLYNNTGSYPGTTGAMMAGGGGLGASGSGGGANWWEMPQNYPQPHGLPPSMADYYAGFSSTNDLWSNGPPSGHQGQTWTFNPVTGRGEWVNSTEGLQIGGSKFNSNLAVWVDPITGVKSIDPGKLSSMFDQFGGGSNAGYENYQMTPYSGTNITAPDAYGGGDWSVPDKINVADVIESYRPTMEAEIGAGFAEAGGRLGQSGWAMSTPYAQQLGDVERLARAQMNQRALEYQYQAAEQDAARQMQRMMAENQEKFQSWQQSGNFDLQSQLANSSNALQQWMLENQIGSQDIWNQNNWNQNQQSMDANNQQMLLQSILGMI